MNHGRTEMQEGMLKERRELLITKTIAANVSKCTECPYFVSVPDGPYCQELEARGAGYDAIVYPEGRDGIHPSCPYLEK